MGWRMQPREQGEEGWSAMVMVDGASCGTPNPSRKDATAARRSISGRLLWRQPAGMHAPDGPTSPTSCSLAGSSLAAGLAARLATFAFPSIWKHSKFPSPNLKHLVGHHQLRSPQYSALSTHPPRHTPLDFTAMAAEQRKLLGTSATPNNVFYPHLHPLCPLLPSLRPIPSPSTHGD